MKPRKNYRTRPKKSGAKKRQRIKSQKKRLTDAGIDAEVVRRLTDAEIREQLKRVMKKKPVKKPKKKPAKKKTAAKAKK
jgi:hypothetical protein